VVIVAVAVVLVAVRCRSCYKLDLYDLNQVTVLCYKLNYLSAVSSNEKVRTPPCVSP
jgi:hypothetical protein